MGLDLEGVRMEVEKHVGPDPETKCWQHSVHAQVKKVLALAGNEAKLGDPRAEEFFAKEHQAGRHAGGTRRW